VCGSHRNRKAVYNGDFGISTIVAVLASGEGHFSVVPPCGMCRELISDYGPGARVIYPDHEGNVVWAPIEDLLPAKWREAAVHPKVPRS
jgi:cytidine deaminase